VGIPCGTKKEIPIKESQFLRKEMNEMKLTRNIGLILLSIWLIVTGLIQLLHFHFSGLPIIMAILAIAAGIFILLQR
jgi:hypothetical protein